MTKFLGDYEITIIEFLNTVAPKYLQDNDISVTKFLDRTVAEFLNANDITVTKFLAQRANDVTVTKFLGSTGRFLDTDLENEISVTKFLTDTAVVDPRQLQKEREARAYRTEPHDDDYHHYEEEGWHYGQPVHHREPEHYYGGYEHPYEHSYGHESRRYYGNEATPKPAEKKPADEKRPADEKKPIEEKRLDFHEELRPHYSRPHGYDERLERIIHSEDEYDDRFVHHEPVHHEPVHREPVHRDVYHEDERHALHDRPAYHHNQEAPEEKTRAHKPKLTRA